MLGTILEVFAFVLFAFAAFAWPPVVDPYRVRLVAAGLLCLTAAMIFAGVGLKL